MVRLSQDKRMLEYGLAESYPDIFCFSTTRHGGCSTGEYASFNCNGYCGDEPDKVIRNQALLASLLPERPERMIIPHQTHDTVVRVIDEAFGLQDEHSRALALEGVDALVTSLPKTCLCVSTADCVPVLCYDTRHRAVAAIHAGWRGVVKRIVGNTLRVMSEKYATRGEDIVACIGPSISLDAFEVGDEVYQCFEDAGFGMSRIARKREKWHLDLWEANRVQLLESGVPEANIELAGICTWKRNDDFFSARRQGIASGRILSGIMLLK